jgi:hypothetical protein
VSFSTAQGLWLALPALLSHGHLWVRKAVLRLLCLGLSDSTLGELTRSPALAHPCCWHQRSADTWQASELHSQYLMILGLLHRLQEYVRLLWDSQRLLGWLW